MLSDKFYCASIEMNTFENHVPAPYMRLKVCLEESPNEAQVFICGLGFYRLFLNGKEITKGILAPYISNPDDICCYDKYEIGHLLNKGDNLFGVILGNGMVNSIGGRIWDFDDADFRSSPKLAFSLICDGKTVVPSAENFITHDSPITFDDLRSGEHYDANKEIKGWNGIDYDDSDWKKVILAKTPKGEKRLCDADPIICSKEIKPIRVIKDVKLLEPSKPQQFENCHYKDEIKAERGYLYDFGVNFSGYVKLEIKGEKGQKVVIQYGEVFENNTLDLSMMYFLPNGYDHRCILTCSGDNDVYEPSFCYFGFQYCLISGITEEQSRSLSITYKMCHSDIKQKSHFRCSNQIADKLFDACIRSDLSNFWYFPTDCPQREKNGWTGDASLSAEQLMLNFDCGKSLYEWMKHIQKAQLPSGELPGIIPTGGWGFAWGNGPAWDAVCVNIPFAVYRHTGNKEILIDNSELIYNYVKYLENKINDNGLYEFGLGDWCPVGGIVKPPLVLTDSVTTYDTLNKACFIFEVLQQNDKVDYTRNKAKELREAIRCNLLNSCIAVGDCQTSQAMCLYYGIFNEDEYQKALMHLIDIIHGNDDKLDCGILGARVIFRLLAENGYTDLAWKMITRVDGPSFGEWIERGATTMWENFGIPQSRNHHFFGDISAFFIQHIAGIYINPTNKNINEIHVSPCLPDELDFAESETDSVFVRTERKDGKEIITIKAKKNICLSGILNKCMIKGEVVVINK